MRRAAAIRRTPHSRGGDGGDGGGSGVSMITMSMEISVLEFKIHIFGEGHIFLRNLHRRFVLCSNDQIYGRDIAKICGLLRTY